MSPRSWPRLVEKLELRGCELILDLNYGRRRNFWQEKAEREGIRFMDGLSPLAFQARRTLQLWTGIQVPPEEFVNALQNGLGQVRIRPARPRNGGCPRPQAGQRGPALDRMKLRKCMRYGPPCHCSKHFAASGNSTVKTVPSPGVLCTSMIPPMASSRPLTIGSPRPVPVM